MTIMKKQIIFIIAILTSMVVSAQVTVQLDTKGLIPVEIKEVQEQAMQNVNEFNSHLSFIASKRNKNNEIIPDEQKDKHIKQALKLFIGNGKRYEDKYGNPHPAVTMEVSSINRSTGEEKRSKQPISNYLERLKNLNYSEVRVSASKSYYIDDIHPLPDGTYGATLTYSQIFVGYRIGKNEKPYVAYRDITKKTIEVIIEKRQYGDVAKWVILLSDISVAGTTLD